MNGSLLSYGSVHIWQQSLKRCSFAESKPLKLYGKVISSATVQILKKTSTCFLITTVHGRKTDAYLDYEVCVFTIL